MAHPQAAEADDAPMSDMDSAAAAIGDYFDTADQPVEEPEHDEELEPEGEDEPEAEEEEGGEDEPETAIAAPVSLTAEEKSVFAQLPEEAQRAWAASETRRNEQVQTATTKASQAQREAESRAATADAQAKQMYANKLRAFAGQMAPVPPNPELARIDPAEYIAQKAQYDAEHAQHTQFVQQIEALDGEASQELDKTFIESRDRELNAIPEVQNEATRDEFFQKAVGAATALGLQTEQLNTATAGEWQKLRQIHDWKTKADKLDALTAKQMQRVRDGKKAVSMKPNAAQPSSGKLRGFQDAKSKAKQSGDVRDAAAAIARLG